MLQLRSFLPFALIVGALSSPAAKPNIIFLLSDDQTIGALGCYGNEDIITPNLDKLADEGLRFTNHYNTTSICMASRACILTGLYEYRHGCNFGHGDLQRSIFETSYMTRLRQAGYYTGIAGKIGLELKDEPFDALIDEFDEWGCGPSQTSYETAKNKSMVQYADRYPHSSRSYGAWAQDFFKSAKQSGQPFCMSISFKAPHMPFTPDPIDLKRYEHIKTFKKPDNFGVQNATHLSKQSQETRAAKGYRQWVNDFDETTRVYYALISGVDAAVGMIREGLEAEGLADNTIIIFTSDNGYNTSSHGFGGKVVPYEEGAKSPLIIYDPRRPELAGTVSDALTANVDMSPTIFALSGVDAPLNLDGKSLLPLLEAPNSDVRESLPLFNFWGVAAGQSMGIVTKEWKYIYWYSEEKGMRATDELFHLSADRLEMNNVAGNPEYAKVLEQMQQAYDTELVAIESGHLQGHRYNDFSTVFDRTTAWSEKQSLVQSYSGRELKASNSKKKKKKQQ